MSLGAFDICTEYPLSALAAIKEHEAHILLSLGVHLKNTLGIPGFVVLMLIKLIMWLT